MRRPGSESESQAVILVAIGARTWVTGIALLAGAYLIWLTAAGALIRARAAFHRSSGRRRLAPDYRPLTSSYAVRRGRRRGVRRDGAHRRAHRVDRDRTAGSRTPASLSGVSRVTSIRSKPSSRRSSGTSTTIDSRNRLPGRSRTAPAASLIASAFRSWAARRRSSRLPAMRSSSCC